MIKNEPKKYVGDYNVDAVRDAYENRGRWYYFLVKEGLSRDFPWSLPGMPCMRQDYSSGKAGLTELTI